MVAEVMVFLFWGGAMRNRREKGAVSSLGIGKPFLMLENLYYSKEVLNLFELYPSL